MKIIVLMTDGENEHQRFVKPDRRTGPSGVWVFDPDRVEARRGDLDAGDGFDADGDSTYSVHFPDRDKWYWPRNGSWRDRPDTNGKSGSAVELTFPQLYARMPMRTMENELFRDLHDKVSNWQDSDELMRAELLAPIQDGLSKSRQNVSSKQAGFVDHAENDDDKTHWDEERQAFVSVWEHAADTRLYSQCDLFKGAAQEGGTDTVIFTIAFEAEDWGAQKMRNCGSGPGTHHDASIETIEQVFDSIARSIGKLRLTQ
jgi:hypothetical protein